MRAVQPGSRASSSAAEEPRLRGIAWQWALRHEEPQHRRTTHVDGLCVQHIRLRPCTRCEASGQGVACWAEDFGMAYAFSIYGSGQVHDARHSNKALHAGLWQWTNYIFDTSSTWCCLLVSEVPSPTVDNERTTSNKRGVSRHCQASAFGQAHHVRKALA